MIIVSAADDKFAPHFATMLHSAWFHDREAEFYLLDCGITAETRDRLLAFSTDNAIRLTIMGVDTAPFADLKTPSYLSTATFAKLLVPTILSDAIDKALYLDADCVVTGDLSPLWATDLSGRLVAGVQDDEALADEPPGMQTGDPYINAGVVLFNVRACRLENFTEAAFGHARGARLVWHDQTALNAVARRRIEVLPPVWNLRASSVDGKPLPPFTPRIIHYTGRLKPWLFREAPLGRVYQFHRRRTPFPLPDPLPPYRSRAYTFLNLLVLRRKYWRRLVFSQRNDRAFTDPYLEAVSVRATSG